MPSSSPSLFIFKNVHFFHAQLGLDVHTLETLNSSPNMPIQVCANQQFLPSSISDTILTSRVKNSSFSGIGLLACGAYAKIKFSTVFPTITLTTISLSLTRLTFSTFSIHLSYKFHQYIHQSLENLLVIMRRMPICFDRNQSYLLISLVIYNLDYLFTDRQDDNSEVATHINYSPKKVTQHLHMRRYVACFGKNCT